jgi:hypothetical protein
MGVLAIDFGAWALRKGNLYKCQKMIDTDSHMHFLKIIDGQ